MKQKIRTLIPSSTDVGAAIFLTLLILLVGNAHDLLQRYGLLSSSQVVNSQLHHVVGSGLGWLDSKQATTNIVTFAIWGVVGLVAFSLVQTLLRATGKIRYEKEFSTNRYVHPSEFRSDSFWRQVGTSMVVSMLLIILSVVSLLLYILAALPASFTFARRLLLQPSIAHIGDFAVGFLGLFGCTLVVYLLLRLTVRQHRSSLV